MNAVTNVVRLQLVNKQAYVVIPLIIMSGSFLLTVLTFSLISGSGPKYAYAAAVSPLWGLMVAGVQALTSTFPFSQALSITRRDFHLGTLSTATLASAMLAAIYVIVALVEKATNHWGTDGHFALPGMDANAPVVAFGGYFVLAMLFFFAGYFNTAVQRRWGTVSLVAAAVAAVIVLTLVAVLITRLNAWAGVASWLAAQGSLGLMLWGLLLVALLAAASHLVVRRLVQ